MLKALELGGPEKLTTVEALMGDADDAAAAGGGVSRPRVRD